MTYKFKIRSGYAFIYMAQIRDHTGTVHPFAPLSPAMAGAVVDLEEIQTRGQLHKLEMVDPSVFVCSHLSCPSKGEKFSTVEPSAVLDGRCPYCGNRTISAVVEEQDRMERAEPRRREDYTPTDEAVEEEVIELPPADSWPRRKKPKKG